MYTCTHFLPLLDTVLVKRVWIKSVHPNHQHLWFQLYVMNCHDKDNCNNICVSHWIVALIIFIDFSRVLSQFLARLKWSLLALLIVETYEMFTATFTFRARAKLLSSMVVTTSYTNKHEVMACLKTCPLAAMAKVMTSPQEFNTCHFLLE